MHRAGDSGKALGCRHGVLAFLPGIPDVHQEQEPSMQGRVGYRGFCILFHMQWEATGGFSAGMEGVAVTLPSMTLFRK